VKIIKILLNTFLFQSATVLVTVVFYTCRMHPLYHTIITGRKFLMDVCAALENTRGQMVFAGLDFELNWVTFKLCKERPEKIYHFGFVFIVFRGRQLMPVSRL
jgi:hypothetical protein